MKEIYIILLGKETGNVEILYTIHSSHVPVYKLKLYQEEQEYQQSQTVRMEHLEEAWDVQEKYTFENNVLNYFLQFFYL